LERAKKIGRAASLWPNPVSIQIAVPQRKISATSPALKETANGHAAGLTGENIRPARPLLFGNEAFQEQLLDIARMGAIRLKPHGKMRRLISSGICVCERVPGADVICLNLGHPAINELRAVLAEMTGVHVDDQQHDGNPNFDRVSPLGHRRPLAFRIMLVLYQAGAGVDAETMRRRLPDVWPDSVTKALYRLVRDRVLEEGVGRTFSLSPWLPQSFNALVLRLAELSDHPRLKLGRESATRQAAYLQASDGAPRLFGTDIRLRNLMALALYGPMHTLDLRKIVGGDTMIEEGRDNAPVGRGSVVQTWETSNGRALALDAAHPLALPLKRLLLRLAEIYPLPPHVPAYDRPEPPPAQAWDGDRLALFGSAIPTKILLTLGNRGWTFEAICCESASGSRDPGSNKRVVTKKVIRRLEDEGILVGSRPRGPGFGPRLLVIAETFPAKDELYALIDAAMAAWPDLAGRVKAEFDALPAKTKEYFRRRGLWSDP
jgi:hypothetical protein